MTRRRIAVAFGLIALLVSTLYLIAIATTWALGIPWDVPLPWALRIVGAILAALGFAAAAWVVIHRGFAAVVESSYATLVKLLRRIPVQERLDRREALVVVGPYRYVRHPMYAGIGSFVLGIGLVAARTPALIGGVLLCLWFALVIAPYEERELRALFGPEYDAYCRATPRFLPIPRRRTRER